MPISIFIYLFIICTALFFLSEYAPRKGKHIIPKTLLCKSMYLIIIIIIIPYTNLRALQDR
jgi:hypothetical protein